MVWRCNGDVISFQVFCLVRTTACRQQPSIMDPTKMPPAQQSRSSTGDLMVQTPDWSGGNCINSNLRCPIELYRHNRFSEDHNTIGICKHQELKKDVGDRPGIKHLVDRRISTSGLNHSPPSRRSDLRRSARWFLNRVEMANASSLDVIIYLNMPISMLKFI